MKTQEQKLKTLLTRQEFKKSDTIGAGKLMYWQQRAQACAEVENGIAVLSDFQQGANYVYAGHLGRCLGLPPISHDTASAFEEEIFSRIPPEELWERHVLELRYFQFQKSVPIHERSSYCMVHALHFLVPPQKRISILHRSYYLESLLNGSIWLALCLYTPFVETGGAPVRAILDNRTGEALLSETYHQLDAQLLSPRETDVLRLLAKGHSSKQIAEMLCLSVHTIYRHRQNILAALQVHNTAAAVEIALRLHLIP